MPLPPMKRKKLPSSPTAKESFFFSTFPHRICNVFDSDISSKYPRRMLCDASSSFFRLTKFLPRPILERWIGDITFNYAAILSVWALCFAAYFAPPDHFLCLDIYKLSITGYDAFICAVVSEGPHAPRSRSTRRAIFKSGACLSDNYLWQDQQDERNSTSNKERRGTHCFALF